MWSHAITWSQETAICHCSMIIILRCMIIILRWLSFCCGIWLCQCRTTWKFLWFVLVVSMTTTKNILTQVTKKKPKSRKKTRHFIGGSHKTWILPGWKIKMCIKLKWHLKTKRDNKNFSRSKKMEQLVHCTNGFQKMPSPSAFVNYYFKI